MRPRTTRLACTVTALAAGACRSATEGGSTVYPVVAAVYGRVAAVDGAPRGGVTVVAEGFTASCGGGERYASGSPPAVSADGTGRYRLVLIAPSPTVLCVRVRAVGPAGSTLAEARAEAVPFRVVDLAAPREREVRDSVRVDLTVP